MSCDVKCYQLAVDFLAEKKHTEADVRDLAQQIQGTVEDFVRDMPDAE